MADQIEPNEVLRTSKAEGDGETAAGITNRPVEEEMANQAALPERGESRPGAHAGHGGQQPPREEGQR